MAEITLSRSAKKLILFVSMENQLWKTLLKSPSQTLVAEWAGLAPSTLSNWKTGATVSDKVVNKMLTHIRTRIVDDHGSIDAKFESLLDEFQRSYDDNAEHVYTTAKKLGISIRDAQIILDDVIYKRNSIFPGMFYDSSSEANKSFGKYGGLYYAWIRRTNFWFRCPLSVRYVFDLGGRPLIRCKLNFINQNEDPEYYEYDGFLVEKEYNLYWFFEKRADWRQDYFSFITAKKRQTARRVSFPDSTAQTLTGSYLTTDQDPTQSIVTNCIFLQQEDEKADEELLEDHMHKSAAIFEGDKCAPIDDVWTSLSSG